MDTRNFVVPINGHPQNVNPSYGTFAYLSTILDAFTKQILAYVASPSLEVDFVLETVNQLVEYHGISLHAETIVHSDQGCHYTSRRFISILYDKKAPSVYVPERQLLG